ATPWDLGADTLRRLVESRSDAPERLQRGSRQADGARAHPGPVGALLRAARARGSAAAAARPGARGAAPRGLGAQGRTVSNAVLARVSDARPQASVFRLRGRQRLLPRRP